MRVPEETSTKARRTFVFSGSISTYPFFAVRDMVDVGERGDSPMDDARDRGVCGLNEAVTNANQTHTSTYMSIYCIAGFGSSTVRCVVSLVLTDVICRGTFMESVRYTKALTRATGVVRGKCGTVGFELQSICYAYSLAGDLVNV